jgi:biotin carboxyl carrier protein
MKLKVTVDGNPQTVEVDLDSGVLRWNGQELRVKVVQDGFAKVEVEIAGERFVVEGWPPGFGDPPGPLAVNGERVGASLVRSSDRSPMPRASALPSTLPARPPDGSTPSGEVPVLPPMPGRIVELRVKVGERVTKGQVLLVVEAMKMRNEVAAPVAGTVTAVRVEVGGNVRAGEPMVHLRPGS